MKQAIAGVAPSELNEVTNMTVWPSVAATAYGRVWGRMFNSQALAKVLPLGLTWGKLVAGFSIPFILPVFFHMLVPRLPFVVFGVRNDSCRRYRLTNRRVIVEHALGEEQRSVRLDRFDHVEVEVLPGQEFYKAGDLVFKLGKVETFRLQGVPRPETFQHTCIKAQQSFVGVEKSRKALAVK